VREDRARKPDVPKAFDFDAPFDFSETMPLPPLFSSLAEEFELMGTLGGGGGGSWTLAA
jgi:hypothetical protein